MQMNYFVMEYLVMDKQRQIEKQARQAWKWSQAIQTKPEMKNKPLPKISQPVAACCSACC